MLYDLTSRVQKRSCNKSKADPAIDHAISHELVPLIEKQNTLTGPTKSGIAIATKATLARIKKNPSKVTILGASHMGKSSTKAFHLTR